MPDLVLLAPGLDPHVSPEDAQRQVPRVAVVRGLPEDRIRASVAERTEGPEFSPFAEPRVGGLRLDLTLNGSRWPGGGATGERPLYGQVGPGPDGKRGREAPGRD